MGYERELEAVMRWVEEADRIAMRNFAVDVATETKQDGTPVTEADRAVEQFLRTAISREFPGDAVVGEEHGESGTSARRWIIDPIDGTKNFARGVPVFATLIALEVETLGVLGLVSAPALHARWWALRGSGAFHDGTPIHVSSVASIRQADVCSGSLTWAREDERTRFEALTDTANRHRGFGDFWGHMLVAQGSMDAMIEFAPLKPWDIAAPRVVVEEAGGRVTSFSGEIPVAGACVSTNGVLHDAVLSALS